MKKCPSEETLQRLAAARLSEGEDASLLEHVRECVKCSRLVREYERVFAVLPAQRIDGPSPADWERVMAGVRRRVSGRETLLPAWAKVSAVAIAAAAVIVVLWQAGTFTRSEKQASPKFAREESTTSVAEQEANGTVHGSDARQPVEQMADTEGVPAGTIVGTGFDSAAQENLFLADTTSLSFASLGDELLELDDWVSGTGGISDSDLLLIYLTEEEEAELVNEIENLPST